MARVYTVLFHTMQFTRTGTCQYYSSILAKEDSNECFFTTVFEVFIFIVEQQYLVKGIHKIDTNYDQKKVPFKFQVLF